MRIWGTQLTGEQISDSMHRTLSGAESKLHGYWNFGTGVLPIDYRAQLRLRFRMGDMKELPLDAWLAVQINYLKADLKALSAARASRNYEGLPYVTTHELLYYPAQGGKPTSSMLGGNYPAHDRHQEPNVLAIG